MQELIERKKQYLMSPDEMIKFSNDRILTIQQIEDILEDLDSRGELQPMIDEISIRKREESCQTQ